MHTLVDWKPRVKGAITEYWNGKDSDNLVDLYTNPNVKMIITYFSLPENSVIAFGNRDMSYRQYKKAQNPGAILKPDHGTVQENVSPHYRLPRTSDYAPRLAISFANAEKTEDDTPILRGKTIVSVDFHEEDRDAFKNQQFEIALFLDQTFHAEDEVGYTPFNWVWNLDGVLEGEHILTVNVSGFRDQIGVLSRKVKIVK